MSTVPTFVIAGAARSGTNALVQGLRNHPRVFVTDPKEPHYFAMHGRPADFRGPGDAATINRVAVTDQRRYLDLYPAEHDYLALGDGSVSTLYQDYAERAAQEMVALNPDMRAVVILRDPVERAHSNYSYMRTRGFEPHEDMHAALDDEDRRKADGWHHIWHYTAMSYYAPGLRILRETLGAQNVGVWFYDDMVLDSAAMTSSVLRFLDVPPDPSEAAGLGRVNVSGQARKLQVTIRWITRHEALRAPVKKLTSYSFREKIRRAMLRPTDGVPDDVRARLEPLFREDLRAVSRMLGVGVTGPHWLARCA